MQQNYYEIYLQQLRSEQSSENAGFDHQRSLFPHFVKVAPNYSLILFIKRRET